MVTLLITSVALIGLFAIIVYYWQKPASRSQVAELPPPQDLRGLFTDTSTPKEVVPELDTHEQEAKQALLLRASRGDRTVLNEAPQFADPALYTTILNILVANASDSSQVVSLASYVTRHELKVNNKLANAFMERWQETPDRSSTTKMLHIAALSDSAETYRLAVKLVLSFWREGKIRDLSAIELQALLSGEFWVLSAGTRNSGAGFLLKRTLASARRELEETLTTD
jgi:hypothetical protein